MNNIYMIPCNDGRPMPARLKRYISERSFLQMRSEAGRARSIEAFQDIVLRFDERYQLHGAVRGVQQGHSMSEVIGATLFSPIGMAFGMGWTGFKAPMER